MTQKLARLWLIVLIVSIFTSIGLTYYKYVVLADFEITNTAETTTSETSS